MRISDWSSDVCSSDLPVSPMATTPTDPPIQTLFARLGSLLSSLFRSEIELAKAEATEKAWQLAFGAGAIVGGSLIALTGVIVLVEALIAALSVWIGLHPAFGALLATLEIGRAHV